VRRWTLGLSAPQSVATLAVAAAIALLLPIAEARAGEYAVYACGGPAGGAQNAFVPSADSMMSAYSICPAASAVGTGVVTKATSSGGFARYGAGAYQVFTAPPGAQLGNVTFNVGAIRLSFQWTVGIVAYDGDFYAGDYPYGCYPWNGYCGVGTSVFSPPATVNLFSHGRFRFETRCVSPSGCDVSASGFTPANRALFSAANVVVRVQDWSVPIIGPHHGALWNSGWHRGYEEAWSGYADNVGIMITRLYADGVLREVQDYRDASWPDWVRCDFTRPRPCVDVQPGGLALRTTDLPDGRHTIRVEAVDAAGNVGAVERAIDVDNSAPSKVSAFTLEGGEQWRSTNDFNVLWTNPPGQTAPIASAHYRICRTGGDGGCVDGTAAANGIEGLSGLLVRAPGEYTLRVWLEDAAGNQDPQRASDAVRLRFDDEPPVALFERSDPAHPTRVAVALADAGSGVASAALEIRGSGERAWRELDASLQGDHLVAELDDASLPDGVYELRAHARDRAGNQRTSDRRSDGSKMELRLPLRLASRVRLATHGARTRCRRRRSHRCAGRPLGALEVTRAGVLVCGFVESAGGEPIPRAVVAVLSRLRTGGGFEALATLAADPLGRFTYRIQPGPSRTVRFQYRGGDLVKPAASDIRVLIPARSSIAVDRAHVLNGDEVTFKGALRGGHVPQGGKLIDLQAYYRGGWRTFATPRTDESGRWRYRYRFGATRGVVRYRFRARIRRETAYPYELGYSRVVRVTVRG
jgi:hypothetical protein